MTLEKIVKNLDFDSTRNESKWKDWNRSKLLTTEIFWNESGFDDDLVEAMNFLKTKINFENLSIIDIGSGKGQSILNLAYYYKFKEIKGIELEKEYIDIFYKNTKLLKSIQFKTSLDKIKIFNINAVNHNFTDEFIIFLFNPFGKEILKKVIDNLLSNIKYCYIIYMNGIHKEIIDNHKDVTKIYEKNIEKYICNPKIVIYEYDKNQKQ